MKQKNKLLFLAIAIFSFSMYNCSRDNSSDTNPNEKLATGKTSLFDEVTTPEASLGSSDEYLSSDITLTSSSEIGPGYENPNGNFAPGILTAGEWNDLENWGFWNNLLSDQEYYDDVNTWNLKEIKRYSFLVKDKNQSLVANAEISLLVNEVVVWKTKTDNKGKATAWSDMKFNNLTATILIDDKQKTITNVKEYAEGINNITFNNTITNKKLIDIFFAVDATGSMGDEIDYLKTELNDVIKNIKQKNPSLGMRFGSVFYRDEGDDYVTQGLSFTTDETSLISFIKEQSARGGGDYPEAVHSALDVSITQNTWDENASSRIVFLLLDAPPHYTQEVISSLEKNLIKAAEQGIKIIPIAASGVNKSTEYLLRSFSILTNGTYAFITDDSGVGNPHIKPTIGEFEVQKLNDLLINLVDEYVP